MLTLDYITISFFIITFAAFKLKNDLFYYFSILSKVANIAYRMNVDTPYMMVKGFVFAKHIC